MCVCVSVGEHISGTTRAIFYYQFFAFVAYGRGGCQGHSNALAVFAAAVAAAFGVEGVIESPVTSCNRRDHPVCQTSTKRYCRKNYAHRRDAAYRPGTGVMGGSARRGRSLISTIALLLITVDTRDFCMHESFTARCEPGSVVLMLSAVYGRMRLGRCIRGDYNVGCSTDVVAFFDAHCTGRRACRVGVRNLIDIHPCQRDFTSYLEASYRCIRGTR